MKKKLILIIDDEQANIDLLKMYLKSDDYDFLTARKGEDALAKAKENKGIDLILLDVMMPDMNGFEVTGKLKADNGTKHIPIALLTSLSDTYAKVTGLEAGCADFISKSADQNEIIARVKSLLKKQA